MRNYPLNLKKYQIDRERYGELRYFCLQYPKKKQQLSELLHASPDPCCTGSSNSPSDPTTAIAIKRDQLLRECELIEQSVLEAVGGGDEDALYQHLLHHVTNGNKSIPGRVPCGRNQFYEYRRKFFFLLDQRK